MLSYPEAHLHLQLQRQDCSQERGLTTETLTETWTIHKSNPKPARLLAPSTDKQTPVKKSEPGKVDQRQWAGHFQIFLQFCSKLLMVEQVFITSGARSFLEKAEQKWEGPDPRELSERWLLKFSKLPAVFLSLKHQTLRKSCFSNMLQVCCRKEDY